MQPPPAPPSIPWTVSTPWAMSSSRLLPGPLWLGWFSAGQPWCLLLDCSGHQAGLLSGQLSRPIFPLTLAVSPPHLSPRLRAMTGSWWDSLPRTFSAQSQGRNDPFLVTGTKFQAICQKPHPQEQAGMNYPERSPLGPITWERVDGRPALVGQRR